MGTRVPPNDGADSGTPVSSGDWPGRELLTGTSPREVLAKLCDGDPLELGPRVVAYVDEMAFLVDPNRAWARSAARVAHAAMRYRGKPELEAFVRRNIVRAIEELIEEETEDELARVPLGDTPEAHLLFLWKLLGVELPLARRASIALNRQPSNVRTAFLALAARGTSIQEHATKTGATAEQVRELVERGLHAIRVAVGGRALNVEGWGDHG